MCDYRSVRPEQRRRPRARTRRRARVEGCEEQEEEQEEDEEKQLKQNKKMSRVRSRHEKGQAVVVATERRPSFIHSNPKRVRLFYCAMKCQLKRQIKQHHHHHHHSRQHQRQHQQRRQQLQQISKLIRLFCSLYLMSIAIDSNSNSIVGVALAKPKLASESCHRVERSETNERTRLKIGILLEESNHEQANMFIRTIKMINEQKDETISGLLNMFPVKRLDGGSVPAPLRLRQASSGNGGDLNDEQEALVLDDLLQKQTESGSLKAPFGSSNEQDDALAGIKWNSSELESNKSSPNRHQPRHLTRPTLTPFKIKLEPVIEFLTNRHSALEADEKVCQLIASGVRAIMGPVDGQSIQHVQSICDTLEIPYFELRSFIGSSGSSMGDFNSATFTKPNIPEERKPRTTKDFHSTKSSNAPASTITSSPTSHKLEDLTLNLYPPSELLNAAYIDLIYALNWTSFAIVYEGPESMIRLQNIFKESSQSGSWTNKWRIRLFQHDSSAHESPDIDLQHRVSKTTSEDEFHQAKQKLRTNETLKMNTKTTSKESDEQEEFKTRLDKPDLLIDFQDDQARSQWATGAKFVSNKNQKSFRDVFWRVKLSGEHNILLDVKTENLYEALKSAQQVGCMSEEFSYLITSLDLHSIDLEDFRYSRTKLTSFSLLQVGKHQQSALRQTGGSTGSRDALKTFDEKYLENLGIHSMSKEQDRAAAAADDNFNRAEQTPTHVLKGARLTPSSPSGDKEATKHAPGYYSSYLNEAESNDQTRRELLQSSPASLGLLPTVDRNNEQRLFDFFLDQQERHLSRTPRLSSSSAILHDSLILLMLGLNELDPSGQQLNQLQAEQIGAPKQGHLEDSNADTENNDDSNQLDDQQDLIFCSPDSRPWKPGSSLVNYMKQITYFNGLSGRIAFDQRGLRTDFKLDVMGMAPNLRLVKVGEWQSGSWPPLRLDLVAGADPTGRSKTNARAQQSDQTRRKQQQASLDDQQINQAFKAIDEQAQSALESNIGDNDAGDDSAKSYDELSSRYESDLKHYERELALGHQVQVPYKRQVSPSGLMRVNEIIFERLYREQADKIDTLVVTAKLSQPYFMLKETPNKLAGNDQFEGYAVDLIHELSKLVNFKYKWREVADKKYGSKEVLANGSVVWNGMIGEIVRGQADLAIVDLTITAQREEAVDFTLPFMNTGISILFKKPTTKVTTLFSFLSPFSSDVWAYVLAAYCGISAILFLVGHLSPYEWADPHPCRHLNPDSDLTVLKNQFSLLNSFWFTIGSLMQQGSDLTPRSMSTRTIAGIWYFFTLIMISSYTANLAAFLTVEKVVYPIENVRDLSQQHEIKYGCVESGSTCLFFHDSQIDTYKKIDETMRHHRTYVRSNDEGQKRVGEGKFAFFMESTTIEYIVERNCNLTQIGGLIDSKGYGLATSKKSRYKRPYRTLLNEGILHLQETGMLHVLKNRWWKEKRGGGTCTDDGKGGGVTELSLANVGGVFVVLLGGLGISFLVAIAEFIWRARRLGSSRDRMCEEMMNDLQFALACKSSTKPATSRPNGTRSGTGNGNGSGLTRSEQLFSLNSTSSFNGNGYRLNSNNELTADEDEHANNYRNHENTLNDDDENGSKNGEENYYSQYLNRELNKARTQPPTWLATNGNNQHSAQTSQFKTPECDPILLHAMLTMLAQQPSAPQPQQLVHAHSMAFPNQANYNAYGQSNQMISHSATIDENLNRRTSRARRLIAHDYHDSGKYRRMGASFSDGELEHPNEFEPNNYHDDNDDMPDAQRRFQSIESTDLDSQTNQVEPTRLKGANQNKLGEVAKRRLLYAQQTIDIDC